METYYDIYCLIIDDLRLTSKEMAKKLGHVGRGRSPSTVYKHYQKMLAKGITRNPILVLKSFEKSQSTAFFCRKVTRDNLTSTFSSLCKDKRLDYVLFLSGSCDFFITSRKRISFEEYELVVVEESKLFTPIFTIPHEWKLQPNEALDSLLRFNFTEGTIQREVGPPLEWKEVDWKVYEGIKYNGRRDFTKVAREIGVWSKTVQTHFFNQVLPCCTAGHYFFPRGYDSYDKAFLKIQSKYEKDIVGALGRYPCTSYVYPFEKDIVIVFFHNSISKLMETMQKLEEIGIIESYLLFIPLIHL